MKVEKPLRILLSAYACEPGKGSEPGVGWNWALSLARRGHQVWVITRTNNREAIEHAVSEGKQPELAKLNWLYYDVPKWASWWKKGGRGVHLYYALWQRGVLGVALRAHTKSQFDLVHHITFGVWRQPCYLYKLGVPLIFGPVGGGEAGTKYLLQTLPLKDRLKESLRAFVNWMALFNPFLRTCFKHAYSVSKTPETASWVGRAGGTTHVSFEIGIDASAFKFNSQVQQTGGMRCLFAGRMLGLKGIHLAIMAIAKAKQQECKISLTLVGRGPMLMQVGELARMLDIENQIEFIDWLNQQELFQQYRVHDVLLFPSLHDSSGNVILEAFAHGLPVVCFKLGGPGVLVDDTCGRAVDVTDDDSEAAIAKLASALIELSDSQDLRKTLSEGARRRAERSTWDATTAAIYDVIESDFSKATQSKK